MKNVLRICSSLFVPIVLVGALSGCDGVIQVEGEAYEWPDPERDAQSEILVHGNPPRLEGLRAISGVEVILRPYHELKRDAQRDCEEIMVAIDAAIAEGKTYNEVEADMWVQIDRTDSFGYFHIFDVIAPGKTTALICARRSGCLPAGKTFAHPPEPQDEDPDEWPVHRTVMIMVCANPTQGRAGR